MARTRLRVAVVGGGLGGLVAALYLVRDGHEVTVFERTPELREFGAGIVVAPNMVRLYDRLGLGAALRDCAVSLEAAWEFRRWQDGRVLFSQPMGAECERLYGTNCFVAHRGDLQQLLAAALPSGVVRAGHRCLGVDADDAGAWLTLATGDDDAAAVRSERFDAVVGADGIHSAVRAAIGARDSARFSGLCAFRCLVPAVDAPEMARRPVQTLWLGPGRHFVHYPISRGEYVNVVGIVPAGDWRDESWTAEGSIDDMRREYAGWDPRVLGLIDSATDTRRWAMFDREPLDHWTRGRVTLLGDAAHAMLPFFAQGACQATEDAAVLAARLRDVAPDGVARHCRPTRACAGRVRPGSN
ncbi:MAG: FAD-dependent monooxygenase [Burkholderiaceae bacterium]